MSPESLLFLASGLVILLEVFFILSRAYQRRDVFTAGLLYLSIAAVFIGLGLFVSKQPSWIFIGLPLVSTCISLIPFFWLLFSAYWGRDTEGNMLSQRSRRRWYYLAGFIAIGLTALNISTPIMYYDGNVWLEASIHASGYVFPTFVFFLIAFLFGLFNIENCYRAAIGKQKRKLQIGFFVSLLLTAMAFAMATLGILQSRLAVWALIGLAIVIPITLFVLAVHLVRVSPEKIGVVVTRRASSASSIILIGALYFLAISILIKAMAWFTYSPDFMVVIISGLMSLSLALAILLSGRLFFPVSVIRRESKTNSTVKKIKEFIEEISLLKTVDEIIERIRLFLRSNFGITGGAFIEQHESGVCSVRYFNRTKRKGTYDRMKVLCEWLHRYGKPILYDDLLERLAGNAEDAVKWIRDMLGFTPSLIVPVIGRQQMIGMLILEQNRNETAQVEHLMQSLEVTLSPIALAIQNCRITDELIVAREIESFNKIASYVLHDLKNSVGMLDMMVVNAKKNIDDPRFRESMFRTISDAVGRQRRIIARLSDPVKEDAQVMTTIDINALLQEVIEKTQVRTMDRIQLTEQYDNLPTIHGNAQLFKSIFENIIVNAVEAMPVNGQLNISTSVQAQAGTQQVLQIAIRDTGIGMSRDFIENKLFRPFTTTKKKGLGVGMYQTAEALNNIGGSIHVASKEGAGTTFTITIPVE